MQGYNNEGTYNTALGVSVLFLPIGIFLGQKIIKAMPDVLQHTRCLIFRQTVNSTNPNEPPLIANDPEAQNGRTRYLSIFTTRRF